MSFWNTMFIQLGLHTHLNMETLIVLHLGGNNTHTVYPIFRISCVIKYFTKSCIPNISRELDNNFTWKKYNVLDWSLSHANKFDVAIAVRMRILFCTLNVKIHNSLLPQPNHKWKMTMHGLRRALQEKNNKYFHSMQCTERLCH